MFYRVKAESQPQISWSGTWTNQQSSDHLALYSWFSPKRECERQPSTLPCTGFFLPWTGWKAREEDCSTLLQAAPQALHCLPAQALKWECWVLVSLLTSYLPLTPWWMRVAMLMAVLKLKRQRTAWVCRPRVLFRGLSLLSCCWGEQACSAMPVRGDASWPTLLSTVLVSWPWMTKAQLPAETCGRAWQLWGTSYICFLAVVTWDF